MKSVADSITSKNPALAAYTTPPTTTIARPSKAADTQMTHIIPTLRKLFKYAFLHALA
jgi:hypothetical protein